MTKVGKDILTFFRSCLKYHLGSFDVFYNNFIQLFGFSDEVETFFCNFAWFINNVKECIILN